MNLKETIQNTYESVDMTRIDLLHIKKDSTYESLLQIYLEREWLSEMYPDARKRERIYHLYENQVQACLNLKEINYTSADITKFCFLAAQEEYSSDIGMYLSILINEHYKKSKEERKEDLPQKRNKKSSSQLKNYSKKYPINPSFDIDHPQYFLPIEHYPVPPRDIGICNAGSVILVKGNVGDCFGAYMNDGTLCLEGNVIGKNPPHALARTGYRLSGGMILVDGNGGDYVGTGMTKGFIAISKSVTRFTGKNMKGGIIFIGENPGNISVGSDMKGGIICFEGDGTYGMVGDCGKKGEIYHKEKLIWKDGRVNNKEWAFEDGFADPALKEAYLSGKLKIRFGEKEPAEKEEK